MNRALFFGAVRALTVPRNREANKREILWTGTYPPYLHAFFCFFQNVEIWNFKEFFSFSLTQDPMGVQIAKPISFHIFLFFNQTF